MPLDEFDRKILTCLQVDATLSVAEIAEPRQSRTNVRRVKVITEPAP